jgi:hypothetical protein
MIEQEQGQGHGSVGCQDTGNPVLDSTVNIIIARSGHATPSLIQEIHATILELAAKEPGGLRYRGAQGAARVVIEPKASP